MLRYKQTAVTRLQCHHQVNGSSLNPSLAHINESADSLLHISSDSPQMRSI